MNTLWISIDYLDKKKNNKNLKFYINSYYFDERFLPCFFVYSEICYTLHWGGHCLWTCFLLFCNCHILKKRCYLPFYAGSWNSHPIYTKLLPTISPLLKISTMMSMYQLSITYILFLFLKISKYSILFLRCFWLIGLLFWFFTRINLYQCINNVY